MDNAKSPQTDIVDDGRRMLRGVKFDVGLAQSQSDKAEFREDQGLEPFGGG
jgi:hypothetical protein